MIGFVREKLETAYRMNERKQSTETSNKLKNPKKKWRWQGRKKKREMKTEVAVSLIIKGRRKRLR